MAKKIVAIKGEYYNAIVDAVCYWLGYQFKIRRDQLIHEASLRYPIADTITANGISIDRIVLEKLHPIFKGKKIDLVVFGENVIKPEAEKDDTNLKDVFEFKLAKSSTSKQFKDEHQAVFDDVVRLAYYNLFGNKNCYFLMCGEYEEFKAYFVGQKNMATKNKRGKNIVPSRKATTTITSTSNPIDVNNNWKPSGIYKEWFGFKPGEVKTILFSKRDHRTWGLVDFQKNYKFREGASYSFSNKIKIKTTCLSITQHGLENVKTHAAGIWKIEAV